MDCGWQGLKLTRSHLETFIWASGILFFNRSWRLFVQASGIFYSHSTSKTTRAPGFNHAHHHVVWLYLCTVLCLLFQHSQRDVRNKAETKHCSSLSCFLWYGIPNVSVLGVELPFPVALALLSPPSATNRVCLLDVKSSVDEPLLLTAVSS